MVEWLIIASLLGILAAPGALALTGKVNDPNQRQRYRWVAWFVFLLCFVVLLATFLSHPQSLGEPAP